MGTRQAVLVGIVAARATASELSALVGGPTRSAQASGAPEDPASAAPDIPGALSGAAGDAHPALARARSGAARHGSARARRIAAARESPRLGRLVNRLHGCLKTLGVGAHRLLTLRAGLNGPARGAAATARILHLSSRREAGLERFALVA